MARQHSGRRDERFFDLVARSNWKVSAGLAAAGVFGAVVVVPALPGGGPLLRSISTVFAQFAWLLAFVFAWVAGIRLFRPQASARAARASGDGAARSSATDRSERDKT